VTAYQLVLFLHVATVATLYGGVALMSMVLRDSVRSGDPSMMARTLDRVQRWNLTMFIPVSLIVLITGSYMLMQFHAKPLWLLVKERVGSLFLVLFILFIVFLGRKWLGQVQAQGVDTAKAQAVVKRYIMVLNLSLVLMTILIFFVTTKIG
jgi:putative membrane protein